MVQMLVLVSKFLFWVVVEVMLVLILLLLYGGDAGVFYINMEVSRRLPSISPEVDEGLRSH